MSTLACRSQSRHHLFWSFSMGSSVWRWEWFKGQMMTSTKVRAWVGAHCCTLLLSTSLAKTRCLVTVYWLELEARDIPTGWNLTWGVVQGGSSRIKIMNSERARHPIYLVPAECCGHWHGCLKFRATPYKVHHVCRSGRNAFFSGREWSTGSPCG